MASRQTLDELRTMVRAKGLRATPLRLAVLELLRASDAPRSHGDVADRLASQAWDRATIYRNLTDLAEAGLVRRTDVRGTDIEIDLLNLMPDDAPQQRSELEEGVETGPRHSHTYYKEIKKKQRG